MGEVTALVLGGLRQSPGADLQEDQRRTAGL